MCVRVCSRMCVRACMSIWGAMYEHLHAVQPGDGVSAHRLRLIRCFSTPGAFQLAWALEVACTGAGRKVAQR